MSTGPATSAVSASLSHRGASLSEGVDDKHGSRDDRVGDDEIVAGVCELQTQSTRDDAQDNEDTTIDDVSIRDGSTLLVFHIVQVVEVAQHWLYHHHDSDGKTALGMCHVEVILHALRKNDTQRKANPHQEECHCLPYSVNHPFPDDGHYERSEREKDDEEDGHENAVSSKDPLCIPGPCARTETARATAIGAATVTTIVVAVVATTVRGAIIGAFDEGVDIV